MNSEIQDANDLSDSSHSEACQKTMPKFDHAYMLVKALPDGIATLESLGFKCTPVGEHGSNLGTANTTVMMPDKQTYLELLTIIEATPLNAEKQVLLEVNDNHLRGIAFGWDSQVAHEVFKAVGIGQGEIKKFTRSVELQDGFQDAEFKVVYTQEESLPGLAPFAIEHLSRDVVWRPDYLDHPNGAFAISALIGSCVTPSQIAAPWQALFGTRVKVSDRELIVSAGTATIEFLNSEAYNARLGRDAARPELALDVIEVTVLNLERCVKCLSAAGIAHVATPVGGILTDHFKELGVSLHFIPISISSVTGANV